MNARQMSPAALLLEGALYATSPARRATLSAAQKSAKRQEDALRAILKRCQEEMAFCPFAKLAPEIAALCQEGLRQ